MPGIEGSEEKRSERAAKSIREERRVYYIDNRGLQTRARFDVADGEGVTTDYDGFGRATASTLSLAGTFRVLTSSYDKDGDRIRITHPDLTFMTYGYDWGDRLGSVGSARVG